MGRNGEFFNTTERWNILLVEQSSGAETIVLASSPKMTHLRYNKISTVLSIFCGLFLRVRLLLLTTIMNLSGQNWGEHGTKSPWKLCTPLSVTFLKDFNVWQRLRVAILNDIFSCYYQINTYYTLQMRADIINSSVVMRFCFCNSIHAATCITMNK